LTDSPGVKTEFPATPLAVRPCPTVVNPETVRLAVPELVSIATSVLELPTLTLPKTRLLAFDVRPAKGDGEGDGDFPLVPPRMPTQPPLIKAAAAAVAAMTQLHFLELASSDPSAAILRQV